MKYAQKVAKIFLFMKFVLIGLGRSQFTNKVHVTITIIAPFAEENNNNQVPIAIQSVDFQFSIFAEN